MPLQDSTLRSIKEYARGIVGGLIFSLPLLYTMEVWWAGFIAHPVRLVAALLVTFVLLLGYNYFAGIRQDAHPMEVVIDSVEELGLGLVVAAGVLFVLHRIHLSMSIEEIVGKVVVEAMAVAIGVSVGTAQLGVDAEPDRRDRGLRGKEGSTSLAGRIVLGLCGAVLFSLNVAPTEEIVVLGLEAPTWKLVLLALASMLLGTVVLYFSDFHGTQPVRQAGAALQVISGVVLMYALALGVSAFILWFFGRFDGMAPYTALAQTIVLGAAAMLGATAGRLLLGA